MAAKSTIENSGLSALPSVDSVLRTETAQSLLPRLGPQHLTELVREISDELRQEIRANGDRQTHTRESLLAEAELRLAAAHAREAAAGLRHVINATGVILHTNLGRAPLSDAARRAVADEASRYCTLELDIATGTRGSRGARVEELLCALTGAEAALVVNNCAAAALLILRVLASDGETILSRGEMVEIGGDFRVPDVMASSGTHLVEVGTTNRTRLADYQKAVNEQTRLVMRVHTSNYRIIGFTDTPTLRELAGVAHQAGLPLYEDAGSGALVDFAELGITGEPIISESIDAGADVISFSGDKLLGGPQAGLIVGRKEIVRRLKAHPMYRALRVDKLTLAALTATLDAYRREESFAEIPVHRMIAMKIDEIRALSAAFIAQLEPGGLSNTLTLDLLEGESAIGGGAAPTAQPSTILISLRHQSLTPDQIESLLRRFSPPVITRIADNRVLLDLRTVAEDELPVLARAVASLDS